VPDTYQGTGFWDFSLVDPDNRRPVDYGALAGALDREAPISDLVGTWQDGSIKQRVLSRLLNDRAASPELYANGSYEPLGPTEPDAKVLAFGRKNGTEELIVAVARLATDLAGEERLPIGQAWGETKVQLPAGHWHSVIEGRDVEIGPDGASLRELFAALPVAVLRRTA
jgi:(1->4)-alpha-D-glucan 1-alpha-D-glucosylmutase